MKNIALKSLFFLIPVAALFLLCNWGVNRFVNNPKYYSVGNHKKILIVGNSQSERGLNDALIDNSINLSQSGDCYFYNYYKIEKIISANPNLNCVVLLYTNNFFMSEMDNWIYDEEHIGYKFPKYSNLISVKDKSMLLYKNPGSFLIASRDAFRTNAQFLIKKPTKIYTNLNWGHFESGEGVIDSLVPTQPLGKFYADTSLAKLDLLYLLKIKKLCKANNKKLILIRMPMPASFPKINEEELTAFYATNLKDEEYWDYANLWNDYSKFMDSQHLNSAAANEFSKVINDRLQKMFAAK